MRLLIAEDERELAKALKTIFEKHNYSVDTVFDGQAALDYALTGNYDGAVLDVMMPVLDGFSVVRRLRARGVSTPVLLLTARSEVPDRVEGLDAGADDYPAQALRHGGTAGARAGAGAQARAAGAGGHLL